MKKTQPQKDADYYAKKYQISYDNESKFYDQRRFENPSGLCSKQIKNALIIEILSKRNLLSREINIIDVASGTGRIPQDLIQEDISRIYVSDISQDMLKVCIQNIRKISKKNVYSTVADIRYFPFQDNGFDVVTLGSFFYLIPLRLYKDFAESIFRILKPGGILVCEVSNALCVMNPLRALKVSYHKLWRKKEIKSYIYPWNIHSLFCRYKLDLIRGVEFPVLVRNELVYNKLSYFLGKFFLTKFFGGKFILVLKKMKNA